MAVSLEDLKPKPFTITIQGQQIECKPLRLSHALCLAKIGKVFDDNTAPRKEQKQAEADMDELVAELMPEIAGVELGMADTVSVLEQMMATIEPSDNKELREKGVNLNPDPKVTNKEM